MIKGSNWKMKFAAMVLAAGFIGGVAGFAASDCEAATTATICRSGAGGCYAAVQKGRHHGHRGRARWEGERSRKHNRHGDPRRHHGKHRRHDCPAHSEDCPARGANCPAPLGNK